MFGDSFDAYIDGSKIRKWDLLEADNCLDLSDVHEFPVKLIEGGKTITEYVYLQMSTIKEHNDTRSIVSVDSELSKSVKLLTEIGRNATYGGFEVCRRKRGVMEGSTLGLFRMTGPLHGFRGRIWFSSPKLDDTYFRINVQKTNCQIIEPKLLNWVKGLTMDYVNNKTKKIYDINKKPTVVIVPPVVAQPEVETEPSVHSLLMITKNTLYNRILTMNPDDFTGGQAWDELSALKQIAIG
jgi:Fe-S cluster assembly iron-binding protein IscA